MKKKLIIFIFLLLICVGINFFKIESYNSFYEKEENFDVFDFSEYEDFMFQNDVKYTQKVVSKKNNLNTIRTYVDYVNKRYDESEQLPVFLKVTLKDDEGKVIESYNFGRFLAKDKIAYFDFKFNEIKDSKNKVYTLEYEAIKVPNVSKLNFSKVKSKDKDSRFFENDKNEDGYTLVYSTYYKSDKKVKIYFIIISIISSVFVFLIYILLKNRNMKIETKFFLIAFVVGITMGIISLSYSGNDEISHFARVYDLSEGNIVTKNINNWPQTRVPGRTMIKILNYSQIKDVINVKDNVNILFDMQYTAVYSYFSYIPQVFIMMLCKIFISHAFLWSYIVRFFQLIICIIIIYQAIKIVPYGKKTIFLIGLIPTVLRQISFISADAMLISCTILYVCMLLKINKDKAITKENIFLLILLSVIIAISKLVYIPLIFLFYILLTNFSKKEKLKVFSIIATISIGITILWNIFAIRNLTSGQGVNTMYFIKYFLKHPFEYVWINLNTIYSKGLKYIVEIFSGNNTPETIKDMGISSLIFIFLFIYALFNNDFEYDKKNKKYIILVIVSTWLLINLSLLLTCTPLYSDYIMGIQGRYFTPLLLLIPLLISKKSEKTNFIINNLDIIIVVFYFTYILKIFSAFF